MMSMNYINPVYSEILSTENAISLWTAQADDAVYYGDTEEYFYALDKIDALKGELSKLRSRWVKSSDTLVCSF